MPDSRYFDKFGVLCCCLVAQLCLTLCDPMDCSLPGSSVHGDSPDRNTRVGCHALFQKIFPIQESNRGLLLCRWILYPLSYQGSPKMWGREAFLNPWHFSWDLMRRKRQSFEQLGKEHSRQRELQMQRFQRWGEAVHVCVTGCGTKQTQCGVLRGRVSGTQGPAMGIASPDRIS